MRGPILPIGYWVRRSLRPCLMNIYGVVGRDNTDFVSIETPETTSTFPS